MSALVLSSGIVHYEFFGRGRPLIFVHGWLGSWRYWVSAMDALSDSFRVYALDLWGYGDSEKSRRQYAVDDYVELLAAFTDRLGVAGPFPLVGHALGATVAVSYALANPQQVERVMAVSLPLSSDSINVRLLSGASSLIDRVLGRSPMAGYDTITHEASRAAPEAVHDSLASVMDLDLRPRLPEIACPLLVLYGENDSVVLPSHRGEFNGAGSSLQVLTMPEARHFPMLDRSSQFNRLLLDFLDAGSDLSALALKDEWQRRVR